METTPNSTSINLENSDKNERKKGNLEKLTELIVELEHYQDRLVEETIKTAQRAKISKETAMLQIEPELIKIEKALLNLREQQEKLKK